MMELGLEALDSLEKKTIFDRRSLNPIKKWWLDLDKVNFLLIFGIMMFGLIMTATSSPAIAAKIGVSKFFFLKKQLIFSFIGLWTMIVISFLDNEKIRVLSFFGIVTIFVFLISVLAFGTQVKGAKRWVSILGFSLQPSEFAKPFFIIFNAFLLHRLSLKKWQVKYGSSALLFVAMALMLLLQPDLGMTLTFSIIWAAQLFVFGLPIAFILIMGFLSIFGAVAAYITFPHVQDRINRFFDSSQANYQVERSMDAVVNGSFLGTGPGNGVVKQYIPDAHTDFIFAVMAEEFGIISCIILLFVFLYLIARIVKRSKEEENMFIYLCLCGLVVLFALQIFINIGVSLKLLPTKGMTLPFISYGGSSMLAMSICFGTILAFTKRKYHKKVNHIDI